MGTFKNKYIIYMLAGFVKLKKFPKHYNMIFKPAKQNMKFQKLVLTNATAIGWKSGCKGFG